MDCNRSAERVASEWLRRPETQALQFLVDLGIEAHISHGVLLVDRTSMYNFSPRHLDEGRAYDEILKGLGDEFPNYRVGWVWSFD